jgi:hypothetical protein
MASGGGLLGADAGSSYKTAAYLQLQDSGRDYQVSVTFEKILSDGKVESLPGIGLSAPFGKAARKTGTIYGTGEELYLETKPGAAGPRSVLCIVTVVDPEKHKTQSEFTLLAPN